MRVCVCVLCFFCHLTFCIGKEHYCHYCLSFRREGWGLFSIIPNIRLARGVQERGVAIGQYVPREVRVNLLGSFMQAPIGLEVGYMSTCQYASREVRVNWELCILPHSA